MFWFKKNKKEEINFDEIFDVDKFNAWFNDPNNGSYANAGIFLRLDKLSGSMFESYFKTFNIDVEHFMNTSYLIIDKFESDIRSDWNNKIDKSYEDYED